MAEHGGGAELMRVRGCAALLQLLQQMCIKVVGDACEEVQTRVATVDVVVAIGVDVHVELLVGLHQGFAVFVGIAHVHIVVGRAVDEQQVAAELRGTLQGVDVVSGCILLRCAHVAFGVYGVVISP